MSDLIYVSSNIDAVDISLHTKETVFANTVSKYKRTGLIVAGIGDGINDLPFLTHSHLDYIGLPNNAQNEVKAAIKDFPNTFISKMSYIQGFVDFYDKCKTWGVNYVFSDRDGVLLGENDEENIDKIYNLFFNMGNFNNPYIYIITGASFEQNIEFIKRFKIMDAIRLNNAIGPQAYYLYAENGAVKINCKDGSFEIEEYYNKSYFSYLKKFIFPEIIDCIGIKLLEKYSLKWADNMDDQIEKVYIPNKFTMLTINIPKQYHNGDDYRTSLNGINFRKDLTKNIKSILTKHGLKYKML